ncbi:2TM domain-containing protein [Zhouia sp. PK063]|uniref:2TM domain-containing protein n=1 Tax=Zhouia sp. PK063 TaxID=3373602 RepID=UPI0037B76718
MSAKNKNFKEFDTDQHELIENAQSRIKQKKRLYFHFIFFLVGSVFLIIINQVLKVYPQYNWFVWAIVLWAFLLIIHTINVFITHKFMGKDWERIQRDKLVQKQKNKIAQLQQDVEKEHPLPQNTTNTIENTNDL